MNSPPFESPQGSVSPVSHKETPSTPLEHHSPNQLKYYNDHLNKSQFNLILINCALNLLKVIYNDKSMDEAKLRFFIIEVLRRSKSSIQTLQIACYYMFRVINTKKSSPLPSCPKKLFLGLIILASKFSQDHNYSFKSWLKICGCKTEDGSHLNLQKLKRTEVECLQLLDYNLFINSSKYENWCNVLLIFGYDFISLHEVNNGVLRWSDVQESVQKLDRWSKFLLRLDDHQLKSTTVNFKEYYAGQIGSKIVLSAPQKVTLLFSKRCHDEELTSSKKACRAQ